jgi:hypothetical protein
MSDDLNGTTPMTHWVISGSALAWNLIGFTIYLMTVSATSEQMAAQYSAAQMAYMDAVPVWATSAYATAVTAGVLACVLLLLRKSLALPVFIVSLAALLIQDLQMFVIGDAVSMFGMVPAYIQGTVLVIAIALIFYTRGAKSRGLLS